MSNVHIKRKCECCKKELCIDKNNINEYIYYDKKTYHSKCFSEICNKRSNSNRTNIANKWKDILNNIAIIKDNSYEHLMSSLIMEDIFIFIQYSYNIKIIPTTVWQRIADINSGNYKEMRGNGIPLEHLFDMWKKKMDYLNSVHDKNNSSGKVMNSQQTIIYDLAILVNKYDSYLNWLEKKRIIEIENETNKPDRLVRDTLKNIVSIPTVTDTVDDDDISSLVDDIFG